MSEVADRNEGIVERLRNTKTMLGLQDGLLREAAQRITELEEENRALRAEVARLSGPQYLPEDVQIVRDSR